jgi:transposase-like protein
VEMRQNGRIVSVAVIVAIGVNRDSRPEMLGIDMGPSDAAQAPARAAASKRLCGGHR